MDGLAPALHVLDPVVAGDALADEPALEVGERDEHGVDRAVGDHLVELRHRAACLGVMRSRLWLLRHPERRSHRPAARTCRHAMIRRPERSRRAGRGAPVRRILPRRGRDRPLPREPRRITSLLAYDGRLHPVGFVERASRKRIPTRAREMFLYELAVDEAGRATAASAGRSCDALADDRARTRLLRHVRAHRPRQRSPRCTPTPRPRARSPATGT